MDERLSRNELPFAPATERNRQPILDALLERMPESGRILEIGAGTGQHAVFMAPNFPGLRWLPTDRAVVLDGLQQRVALEGCDNLLEPEALDVLTDAWPVGAFDAVFSANTAHIMSWAGVVATFGGVGQGLVEGGKFFLYGPFNVDGTFTSESNQAFDASLRARDPDMGIRDMGDLEDLAARHQMSLDDRLVMPANNFLLVFSKEKDDN